MQNFNDRYDWERTVILELNREHEYTCRIHKVNLRPVAITLFDSETLWGQFDSLTRTISISRKLVNEFSWHNVVGVFRHEMAHQFVAEQNPQVFASEKPHSERFKDACRRLGVPEQFARAGLNLQTGDVDWRTEQRDEVAEKILDKVKKLLALANSTNEHEALLAMERVRDLYGKYNLENLKDQSAKNFVHLVITHGKKRMESWEQRTISILTEHFFVKVLTFQQFNPKTGKRVHAIEVIGTKENVLMAEYVYHFLLYQVEALLKETIANGTRLIRSERASYKLGVLDGFSNKLKSAEKTTENNPGVQHRAALTVIGQALAKFREDPGLEEYLSEIYPSLGHRRESAVAIDDRAFAVGHAVGRSITLNKPIANQMGNQGKVISGGYHGKAT